jgi:hypothetical protein
MEIDIQCHVHTIPTRTFIPAQSELLYSLIYYVLKISLNAP